MTYKLYIDDLRTPNESDWVVVRTVEEARATLLSRGIPTQISFDHDLGMHNDEVVSAVPIAWFIIDGILDGHFNAHVLKKVNVHSDNPPGVRNIVGLFESFSKVHNIQWEITAVKNGSYVG